ncbi:MAG TPA: DUF480 domain-containing protein [Terriglobales bacterium]|nr:DUF480 domain-containing protein [Terriglobales bacterium]
MKREIQLEPYEARLLGVLIEKALTTPDGYPLTLNAAINAANQKSNREPVLNLDEVEVAKALAGLERKYLARKVFPGNSRVEKYIHIGKECLGLDALALATLAELMMRGPQTLGELRTHVGRMLAVESLDKMIEVLAPLIENAYVERLPPSPGSRAERFAQLLCPNLHPIDMPSGAVEETATVAGQSRLATLTLRLDALEAEVKRLRQRLEALEPPEPPEEPE